MKKIHIFLFLLVVSFFASVNLAPYKVVAATFTCANITTNLQLGDTNSTTGNQVYLLQNFLLSAGYTTTAPTGRFGPVTQVAVKALQSANAISATGYVGSVTRALIQKKSCTIASLAPIVQTNTQPAVVSQVKVFNTPIQGDYLKTGINYTISWNNIPDGIYNIVLEDINGAGAGVIASYQSGGVSYQWKVGKVYSSGIQSDIQLEPGMYRIRIMGTAGKSSSDKVSGYFTITGQPLAVNSVMPTSVQNDNYSTVVLYGSGFDSSSRVYFDSIYGIGATMLYTSPDGKAILFAVPKNIPTGSHILSITSTYASSTNIASINVTN